MSSVRIDRWGERNLPLTPESREDALLPLIAELVAVLGRLQAFVPQVHVAAPDLGPLLDAIRGWKPPEPVVNVAAPQFPGLDLTPLSDLLERLSPPEFVRLHEDDLARMKPDITVAGASRVSVRNRAGRDVDPATQQDVAVVAALLADVKRGLSDYDQRFDYGSRTDGQPERVGHAPEGTAPGAAAWLIETYTYDGNGNCTLIERRAGQQWSP